MLRRRIEKVPPTEVHEADRHSLREPGKRRMKCSIFFSPSDLLDCMRLCTIAAIILNHRMGLRETVLDRFRILSCLSN